MRRDSRFNVLSVPNEYQECYAYAQWCQYNPLLKEFLIKHVNEGKRKRSTGYYLQLIGMAKGLPDFQIPIRNDKYIGLWIEMKRKSEKGEPQREEQIKWLEKLKSQGHYATFAYGAQEAINITLAYLNNKL